MGQKATPSTAVMLPGNIIRRTYAALTFSPNKPLTLDMLRDATILKAHVRISGHVTTTWSSGTPVTSQFGTLGSLIESITIRCNGRTVKQIQPYMGRLLQMYALGQKPEQKSSAGASAAAGDNPTADAAFEFGSTTNITTAAESLEISFVDRLAAGNLGQTYALNLRRCNSAQILFQANAYSNVQAVQDTTVVTYASDSFNVQVTTEEVLDLDSVMDLRETYFYARYAAQANGQRVDIPIGNKVRGIGLLVRDGGANRTFSNTALTKVQAFDNSSFVLDTTFQDQQAKNRTEQAGIYMPFSSNVSPMDGFAFFNFSHADVPERCWDLRDKKQAWLLFSTAVAGSGATYTTNPVEILIHMMEYLPIPGIQWPDKAA